MQILAAREPEPQEAKKLCPNPRQAEERFRDVASAKDYLLEKLGKAGSPGNRTPSSDTATYPAELLDLNPPPPHLAMIRSESESPKARRVPLGTFRPSPFEAPLSLGGLLSAAQRRRARWCKPGPVRVERLLDDLTDQKTPLKFR